MAKRRYVGVNIYITMTSRILRNNVGLPRTYNGTSLSVDTGVSEILPNKAV